MSSNIVRRISPLGALLLIGLAVIAALMLVFGGPDVAGCFGVTGC